MPTVMDQLREEGWIAGLEKGLQEGRQEGRQEGWEDGLKAGIQIALESKYGEEGLALYRNIHINMTGDILTKIGQALRNGATLKEVEQLLKIQ